MRTVGGVGASDYSKADTHNKHEETVSRRSSSSPSWPGTLENANGNHDEQLKKRIEQLVKKDVGIGRSVGLGTYITQTCVAVEMSL